MNNKTKTKKDFSNIGSIAATRFLNVSNIEEPKPEVEKIVEQDESSLNKTNTKSKRLNLLIYPNLFTDGTKIARMKQISFNDYVNRLIQKDIEENQKLIIAHDEVFKK